MPAYDYECPNCKKAFTEFKPMSQSQTPSRCPDCDNVGERLYTASPLPQFKEYYDEQFGAYISSARQEEKLMKKHKQIYTADIPKSNKVKALMDKKKWELKKGITI